MPTCRLGDVDQRSAERSISDDHPHAAMSWRRSLATGCLQREERVAALLDVEAARVDLVVAVDELVGALEVAVEQHLVARGMVSTSCAARRTISSWISSSSWWKLAPRLRVPVSRTGR